MNRETPPTAALRPAPGPGQPTAAARHFGILLSATPRGARLARRLAAEELHRWGWPHGSEANRTATLLVAELATNAVRHGRVPGRDFRLRLTLQAGDPELLVEVTDASPGRPLPVPGAIPPPSAEGDGGRGLLLVEALSSRWGATGGDPYTKTVWCEVTLR
ncbi:ATP-binding protein [Streptomyces sp. NPDC058195]|uniref:ATP-binding protein n=1 Tax=Streptomyces sp. NPDC058195 TaxID=3346375 RepID=UPI0036E6CD3E